MRIRTLKIIIIPLICVWCGLKCFYLCHKPRSFIKCVKLWFVLNFSILNWFFRKGNLNLILSKLLELIQIMQAFLMIVKHIIQFKHFFKKRINFRKFLIIFFRWGSQIEFIQNVLSVLDILLLLNLGLVVEQSNKFQFIIRFLKVMLQHFWPWEWNLWFVHVQNHLHRRRHLIYVELEVRQ